MAEPKKRLTSHRSGNRRSHLAAKPKALATCSQCKKAVEPHKVCGNCGFYNGSDVLGLEAKAKAKADKRQAENQENE